MKRLIFTILFLMLIVGQCFAATYYVKTGGDLPTGLTDRKVNKPYFYPSTVDSPAVANGTNTLVPQFDIDGFPYNQTTPSIGAYENKRSTMVLKGVTLGR